MDDDLSREEWAVDTPPRSVSRPYKEDKIMGLRMIKNNIFGPSKRYKKFSEFIPGNYQVNEIEPKIRIGFTGDLMPLLNKKLVLDNSVISFFSDIDYLVCNFEGSLKVGEKAPPFAQIHNKDILNVIEEILPPEKIILGVANNHTADFGYYNFLETCKILKDLGFLVPGKRDEPSVRINKNVQVAVCTQWTNQDFKFLSFLKNINNFFEDDADLNILYPHWGCELDLYPRPKQIKLAQSFLDKWGVIVGHHSHIGGPVTIHPKAGENRLVAYSLGDFCTGLDVYKYLHGIIVKIEAGPGKNGKWLVGKTQWKFTSNKHDDKDTVRVEAKDSCPYFKNIDTK